MTTKDFIASYKKFVMPTYTRLPLVLAKGRGAKVWDLDGNEYLDFFPGWAVSGLGHCHPKVVKAIKEQAAKILHVSNNYMNELQAQLAEKLVKNSFDGKVFFANSGAEANEGALKLARKYGNPTSRFEVITMEKSFHGRTLAMIAATGQDKVKKGFGPLPTGFKHVPFNDLPKLEGAISDKTVAIMLEPIQGEGGIRIADKKYLKQIRELCDEKDILLIFDEVQTGMGRTGEMFAFKNLGVEPDIMTLAKSLGSGLPIGAVIAKRKIADTLGAGTHASTFGGSPLAASAALATINAIEEEGLLENAKEMGAYLLTKLEKLKKAFPIVITEIRGMALMIGLELTREGEKIYKNCLKKGLLINCTQKNVLRIMPPLTVKKGDINKAIKILEQAIKER